MSASPTPGRASAWARRVGYALLVLVAGAAVAIGPVRVWLRDGPAAGVELGLTWAGLLACLAYTGREAQRTLDAKAAGVPRSPLAGSTARLVCCGACLVGVALGSAAVIGLPRPEVGAWGYGVAANAYGFVYGALVYFSLGVRWPDGYFRPRAFERSGRLYRWAGVVLFARLVRRGLLAFAPFSGRRGDLASYERGTRDSEASHLLIFAVVLLFPAYDLACGRSVKVGPLLLINVALNAYPALLQRCHRARLDRLLRRRD